MTTRLHFKASRNCPGSSPSALPCFLLFNCEKRIHMSGTAGDLSTCHWPISACLMSAVHVDMHHMTDCPRRKRAWRCSTLSASLNCNAWAAHQRTHWKPEEVAGSQVRARSSAALRRSSTAFPSVTDIMLSPSRLHHSARLLRRLKPEPADRVLFCGLGSSPEGTHAHFA